MILAVWAQAVSPLHELGHVIFGWLSFNPTIITGWNSAASMRDGFFVAIGGYTTQIMAPVLLLYFLRRQWWFYPIVILNTTAALYSLQYQGDFPTNATGALLIWWLCGVLSYILTVYIGLNACLSTQRRPSCNQHSS
jgi:hypothetical protein